MASSACQAREAGLLSLKASRSVEVWQGVDVILEDFVNIGDQKGWKVGRTGNPQCGLCDEVWVEEEMVNKAGSRQPRTASSLSHSVCGIMSTCQPPRLWQGPLGLIAAVQ